MAAHAEDGEIIIGEPTAGEIHQEFPLEDLGKATLKNVSQPVRLYRVPF
jgi:class 3 adenylate cyclase